MAKIHLAAPGVTAPTTTNEVSGRKKLGFHLPGRTRWGGDGECAGYDPQNDLFKESGVYASIDDWDGAAAVFPGLHGGLWLGILCPSPLSSASGQSGLSDATSRCRDIPRSTPSLHHGPSIPRRFPGPRLLRCRLRCSTSLTGDCCRR